MSTSTAIGMITTSTVDIGSILAGAVPYILGLAVVLIGLAYLWSVLARPAIGSVDIGGVYQPSGREMTSQEMNDRMNLR